MYENLKKVMRTKKLNQSEVADMIGMSPSTLNRKLMGHVPFEIDECVDILNALSLNVEKNLTPMFLSEKLSGVVKECPRNKKSCEKQQIVVVVEDGANVRA